MAGTVAAATDGALYTFGDGKGGKLGHGDELTMTTPRFVEELRSTCVVEISAAYGHTMARDARGTVWTCGWGEGRGQT